MEDLRDLIEEIDKLLLRGEDLELAEERVEVALKVLSPSHSGLERARVYSLAARVKLELGRNYEEAERYALKSFDLLKNTALHQERAKVQFCLGRIYVSLGNLEKARCFFEDSLSSYRLIGNTDGILDAVNGLSWVSFILSERDEAIKRLEYGLAESKKINDPRRIALFSGNLGVVYLLASRWQEAEEKLNFGLKIYESIGDILQIARRSISLARLYLRERRWSEASRLIQKAKEVSEEHTLSRELTMSLESEGALYFEQKEYAKAERCYLDGLKIGERISSEGDVVAELCRKLAELYVAIKDPDKAIAYGQRGLKVSIKLGDRFEQGCCHRALALAYDLKGLQDKSQEEFAQAVSLLRSIGERFELAHTLLVQGKLRGRLNLLREAHNIFADMEKAGYYAAVVRMEMARVEPSFKLAVEGLREAEEILRAQGEAEKLKEVQALKLELNQKLRSFPSRKYEFLQGFSSGDLEKVFAQGIEVVGADRGFVAYRRSENRGMEIGASCNLSREETRGFLSLLTDGDGFEVGQPFILYDSSLDERFSAMGAGSLMLIPYGDGERVDGYLYVDRRKGREPFLEKELDLFYLLSERVAKAIAEQRQRELERTSQALKQRLAVQGVVLEEIITQNEKMLKVLREADKVKDSISSILIQGKSGTGKELVARKIHFTSRRSAKRIIPINCGAIPNDLLEAELFGCERGAFTGAVPRKGLIEEADGGTLFLDEVGNLSLSHQAKLLRVLEEGKVRRVGGNKERAVDVRVIAATNKDLVEEIKKGKFREDLYYRLNTVVLELPSLKERRDDIRLLAQYFLDIYSRKCRKNLRGITEEALKLLEDYSWPGNVRELKSEMERAVLMADEGEEITPELLSKRIKAKRAKMLNLQLCSGRGVNLKEIEKEAIQEALKKTKGAKYEASKLLGIGKSTLYRKVKEYGLS